MRIILIRHGHAGRKADWHRADRLRPLSALGTSQAEALVDVVAALEPVRIISSPLVRCISTAEPLASKTGLKVERSTALVPDAPSRALRLVRRLGNAKGSSCSALVTHGEVMGDVLRTLAKDDGLKLEHRPPGLKGCAWILEFQRDKLVDAHYLPPI